MKTIRKAALTLLIIPFFALLITSCSEKSDVKKQDVKEEKKQEIKKDKKEKEHDHEHKEGDGHDH